MDNELELLLLCYFHDLDEILHQRDASTSGGLRRLDDPDVSLAIKRGLWKLLLKVFDKLDALLVLRELLRYGFLDGIFLVIVFDLVFTGLFYNLAS